MGPYGPLRIRGAGQHGWFWVFSGITMVLFWVLLLLLIVLIVRALTGRSRWGTHAGTGHSMPASPAGPAPGSAEQLLADRLARGDIDVDDYHRRMAALQHGSVPPAPPGPPAPPQA